MKEDRWDRLACYLCYPGGGGVLCLGHLGGRTWGRGLFAAGLQGQGNLHRPVSKTGKVYAEIGGSGTEGIELGPHAERGFGT